MKSIDLNDFNKFCTTYYPKHKHYTTSKDSFVLRDYQLDIIESINRHQYNIIGKSRQMGLSTLFQLYATYLLLNGESIHITLAAHNRNYASEFIRSCKDIIESVYSTTRPPFSINNVSNIKLLNNQIEIHNNYISKDLTKFKNNVFIADEANFIDKLKEQMCEPFYVKYDKYILYSSSAAKWSHFNEIWCNTENKYSQWQHIICLYNRLNNNQIRVYKHDDNYGWYEIIPESADTEYIVNTKRTIGKDNFDFEMCFKHQLHEFKPNNNKTQNVNIRLNMDMHSKIKSHALIFNMTVSEYIRKLINKDLS